MASICPFQHKGCPTGRRHSSMPPRIPECKPTPVSVSVLFFSVAIFTFTPSVWSRILRQSLRICNKFPTETITSALLRPVTLLGDRVKLGANPRRNIGSHNVFQEGNHSSESSHRGRWIHSISNCARFPCNANVALFLTLRYAILVDEHAAAQFFIRFFKRTNRNKFGHSSGDNFRGNRLIGQKN